MSAQRFIPTQTITIAAALINNPQGQTLLVRKHGTACFMQPGGKIDGHEHPLEALARELSEELSGFQLDPAAVTDLGIHTAVAANEPDTQLVAHLFGLTTDQHITHSAEIAELIWVDPANPPDIPLAPFTRDVCLPRVLP